MSWATRKAASEGGVSRALLYRVSDTCPPNALPLVRETAECDSQGSRRDEAKTHPVRSETHPRRIAGIAGRAGLAAKRGGPVERAFMRVILPANRRRREAVAHGAVGLSDDDLNRPSGIEWPAGAGPPTAGLRSAQAAARAGGTMQPSPPAGMSRNRHRLRRVGPIN